MPRMRPKPSMPFVGFSRSNQTTGLGIAAAPRNCARRAFATSLVFGPPKGLNCDLRPGDRGK